MKWQLQHNKRQKNEHLLILPSISGQISAVMSVVEAIVPVVANPTYSKVYQETFGSEFPGAVFLVTGVCMIVCIIAFT